MQEMALWLASALAAAAAGYFGGRWHGTARYITLSRQYDQDTEEFRQLLAERDESYLAYKAKHADQTDSLRRMQLEQEKLEARLVVRQEREQELVAALEAQETRFEKWQRKGEEWQEERARLSRSLGLLEAEKASLENEQAQLNGRLKSLQERFETLLQEKSAVQTELAARQREASEYRRRAQKLEDAQETTELSFSQMRVARDELASKLAAAEGRLSALESQSGS